ncbi:hypothetical protein ACJA25_00990 [Mycoplasmopsis hyopharyngis]|uniref:hypothetical protein n=1 Tax=Mycoplasmopsis hyopharyngis TaxID=29558 RepID=UPI0038731A11
MKEVKWTDIEPIIYNDHNKDIIYFLEFISKSDDKWKIMNKILEKVEKHFADQKSLIFLQIDADEANLFNDLNSNFEIFRCPAHIILKNKEIIFKGYDNYPKEILISILENNLD